MVVCDYCGYLICKLKKEIVSGTRSEDSVTLRLSSLQMLTRKCIVFVFFSSCFFYMYKKRTLARAIELAFH